MNEFNPSLVDRERERERERERQTDRETAVDGANGCRHDVTLTSRARPLMNVLMLLGIDPTAGPNAR